jgi:branched-chain amino acid transport system ATP-binding protein
VTLLAEPAPPVEDPKPPAAGPARWFFSIRHPAAAMRNLTQGGPVFALIVLFGLNAVDELDRTAFGILLPEIRDAFDLDLTTMLTIIALVAAGALALQVPIAHYADRTSRVRLMIIGAIAWSCFSFLTGLATTVLVLGIARAGSGIGKAVNDPTHQSLIADWYPPAARPGVFSFYRAANAVGAFIGPLVAGLLAYYFSWRVPFIVFAFPTLVFVLMAFRLRDPVRGGYEREAMGASAEAIATEEDPPSFAEGWRLVWKITSLRRIWYALPFLAASLIGFVSLASLLYEEIFGLDELERGVVSAITEPVQLVGLIVGARIGTRLFLKDPGLILVFLGRVSFAVAGLALVFALAPTVWIAVIAAGLISGALAMLLPGILASLSLAIPPRARSLGFSIASLWVLPGLIILPVIGLVADAWGIRLGMCLLMPVFLVGGVIIASASGLIKGDIEQVWKAAAARSEVLYERRQGNAPLLVVRGLDVAYDGVQVLFGVDLDIQEGEIVALLGTNGAGKSTLLRAISGVIVADRGAVIFDGRDVTYAPAEETAARGVVQVPGGAGVFPSLTVEENLRLAGWLHRRDQGAVDAGRARVLELFPVLGRRLDDPAADLSGGQQQMLALGMALISKPRLLMIDELTLGLAPVVVEQLLPVVREVQKQGTTVILVEQSVNLALTLAERAYFMEKGEVRFQGPTAELLERPDILRSVFLEGAGAANGSTPTATVTGAKHAPPSGPAPGADLDAESSAPQLAALDVRAVARSFGGIRAVDDVDLEVAAREIVGIIGPNGAGKTTLFDLISGFTPIDKGQVVLGDRDLTGLSPDARSRAGLSRSFQDARLFPALTVAETLAVALDRWVEVRDPLLAALHLPASFDSEEKIRHRVDDLIDLFGLGAFRNKFVHELSTGSRRIVDLACVVAHRPSVVLLDEPSSGIAQRETEALAPVIVRIRDEIGCAVVLIEHDMGLITAVAPRLVAMDQGRVIADGPAAEVLHDTEVVASYLGADQSAIARSGAAPGGPSGG